MSDFNSQIIDEFRSNDGTVTTYGFDRGLVLVHNVGAKSGELRVNPVAAIREDGGWLVPASAAGARKNPAWYHNLIAHPETEVEYPNDDGGISTAAVVARELTGPDCDAAWERFVGKSPSFADYQTKAGDRVIPVVLLEPR